MRRAHDSHPDRMSPARRVFECLCRTQQTVAVESPFIDILPCLGQNIRRKILAEGGEHAYARGRDVVGGVLQQVDIAAEGLFHLFTALFDVPCALSRPCNERSRSKDAPGVLPAAEGGEHVAAHEKEYAAIWIECAKVFAGDVRIADAARRQFEVADLGARDVAKRLTAHIEPVLRQDGQAAALVRTDRRGDDYEFLGMICVHRRPCKGYVTCVDGIERPAEKYDRRHNMTKDSL